VSEGLVTRLQTAHCLRLIRRYQTDLRREVRALASALDKETARIIVRRVKRLWLRGPATDQSDEAKPWPQAA